MEADINAQQVGTYRTLFREHGYSPLSLGWTKGKQFLRFHQLTRDFELNGASILDVGCGFGDLNHFLGARGIEGYSYLGIDLVPEFIATASANHPASQIRFLNRDFLACDLNETFDYGLASGTFNHRLEGVDRYDLLRRFMEKIFASCRTGMAIDFLTDKVDFSHHHNFHYDPAKVLDIGYSLTRNLVLRNDYFPFECALILHRDGSFRRETTVFNSIAKDFGG